MTKVTFYDDIADHFSPLEVQVINNNFESAFREFKLRVQKSKILGEIKKRRSYEKPSEKNRRKQREHIERARLAMLMESQMKTGEWQKKQKEKEKKRQDKYKRRQHQNSSEKPNE